MKKFLFIVFYGILLFPTVTFGQQVTYNQAKTAAVNVLKYNGRNVSENMVEAVIGKQEAGHCLVYEVHFQDGTLVLVSGHNSCLPILGIIKTTMPNNFTSLFDIVDSLPPAFQDLMVHYMNQVISCFENSIDNTVHPNWNALSVYDVTLADRAVVVGPLLTSRWGQNRSNDLSISDMDIYAYNYYVHNYSSNSDTICTSTPAGCVAVAMGQILRYWSSLGTFAYEPSRCWGYEWNNMPDELLYQSGGNSQYEEQKDAVAALLRDCGANVEMVYNCNESYVPYDSVHVICPAFRNYGFSSHLEEKDTVVSSEWNYRIQDDLNNGYPILYLGIGTSGHAFVCDGYIMTGNTYFYHFNWGWRGYFDGWFTIDDLTPGSHNYSDTQYAIFNIHPDDCRENIIFGCDKHFLFENASYSAEITIQNDYHIFSVMYGSSVVLKSGDEIILTDGFYAANGSDFVAKIEGCPPDDLDMTVNVGGDGIGERGLGRDAVHHVSTATGTGALTLYPNPAHNTLTVESAGPIREITVYDLSGRVMMTVECGVAVVETCCSASLQQQYAINVSSLHEGIYLLKVVTDNGIETAKFVKN